MPAVPSAMYFVTSNDASSRCMTVGTWTVALTTYGRCVFTSNVAVAAPNCDSARPSESTRPTVTCHVPGTNGVAICRPTLVEADGLSAGNRVALDDEVVGEGRREPIADLLPLEAREHAVRCGGRDELLRREEREELTDDVRRRHVVLVVVELHVEVGEARLLQGRVDVLGPEQMP